MASVQENPADEFGKSPGFRKNLISHFRQYTSTTGIHGFAYIGEPRSTIEKLVWLLLFIVSLYFCIVLIDKTWIKWEQAPVLVSFATGPTQIWQVPFPAITICPYTKIKTNMYNFTENFHKNVANANKSNTTAQERAYFQKISLLCDPHLNMDGEKLIDFNTIKEFIHVSPKLEEAFYNCTWLNEEKPCDDLFTTSLTEDGVCFTFNMLDRREFFTDSVFTKGELVGHSLWSRGWSLSGGYPKGAALDTFPKRAVSTGARAGLQLVLRTYKEDLDYICRGPVQGFKLMLHHPAEAPRVGTQYSMASIDTEVVTSVMPQMMVTAENLRKYQPDKRNCFFTAERHLKYFRTYTQNNCQLECKLNYTLTKCGCIMYYMPYEDTTKFCGSKSKACLIQSYLELTKAEVKSGPTSATNSNGTYCNCLPSCTSLTYQTETTIGAYNWRKHFAALNISKDSDSEIHLTKLTIFFKELQFFTSERNELYELSTFLANCGGLLGLFTGFTFLSFFEVIYFLTLRLMCNVRKYGKDFWGGPPDTVQS